jgi:DNA invertase Pin-like site-specific DNA recombinase
MDFRGNMYPGKEGGETMKKITKIDAIELSGMQKLRVAAYARVSTNSDEQLASLDAQKIHYESLIKANSEWKYAGLYYDEGISGTKKDKRLGLLSLIKDCEDKKVDFIMTKSISRFSRNTMDCLALVRKLIDLGIYIYFEKENINTGSMDGELMLSILSSLAESESVSLSQNTKWSIEKRFENGTYKIAYAPYGYDCKNGNLVINQEQAEIVKWIFKEMLSGTGTTQIADILNEMGISTQRGGKWSQATIGGIIKNERYTGDALFQKTYTDASFNRHKNFGEKNMYFVENHHEAIISHNDFDKVNAIMNQRRKEKGIINNSDKYLKRYTFSGKIKCAECGHTFKRRIHNLIGQNPYVAWTCKQHLLDKNSCTMKAIKDEAIKETFVLTINKLIYGHKFVLKPLIENLRQMNHSESYLRIEEIEKQINQYNEQNKHLTNFLANGYINSSVFVQEQNALEIEYQNLRSEKEMLSNCINNEYSQINEVDRFLKFVMKSDKITQFNDEHFTEFVDKIIVYSQKEVGFKFKCGITLRERLVKK